jgi:hypothetical protein
LTFCVPAGQIIAEFPGPQRGDKVLLINPELAPGVVELLHLVFRDSKVHLAIVPTVAEAIGRLSDPFDLLWLLLPLPDLQTSLWFDFLPAEPDLASRVGIESIGQALFRLSKIQAARKVELLVVKPHDKWIWVRVRTEDERERVRHLLEQCTRKDAL